MSWVDFIVADLCPSIGGFPTFCEDPDELLQLPEVRTALERAGMSLGYWDGSEATLCDWAQVPPVEKPLVIVEHDYPKHVVTAKLTNHMLESISIGEVFSKFHGEIVRLVPKEHWDALYLLQQSERPHRTPDETAILVARAFYGLDPLHLAYGSGWNGALTNLYATAIPVPERIARAVIDVAGVPLGVSDIDLVEILASPTLAKARIKEIVGNSSLTPDQEQLDAIASADIVKEGGPRYGAVPRTDWVSEWNAHERTPDSVLQFAVTYAAESASDLISHDQRIEVNRLFFEWLRVNYVYAMTSQSSTILRLPTLVKRLDDEVADVPLLLVVVDAMGVESWTAVKQAWSEKYDLIPVSERAAFALLPTLTNLSRRSLFEGRIPAQFGTEEHSQDFERRCWRERFGEDSGYFTPGDTVKLDHAYARRTRRVAVVDVAWDSMGHAIFPESDTIAAAARRWALATPTAGIIRNALDHGYRVFLTADHGQVPCVGTGRLNVGILAEQRSKRATLFENNSLLQGHAEDGIANFQPYGLPKSLRVLFSQDLTSFDLDGVHSVSHGGASIEEVIVPVIEVSKK